MLLVCLIVGDVILDLLVKVSARFLSCKVAVFSAL